MNEQTLRRTLFLIGVGAIAAFLTWELREVLLLVFAALLVAVMLDAGARPLASKLRLPMVVAVATVALLAGAVILGAFWFMGTEVRAQVEELARLLPGAWASFQTRIGVPVLESFTSNGIPDGLLDRIASTARTLAGLLADAVVGTLLVLFGGIYIAAQPQLYRDGFLKFFRRQDARDRAARTLDAAGDALLHWLQAQFLAMVIIGVVTAIGLLLLGIPSWLALGLLAGLAEFVPFVGPVVAAAPAVLLAFSVDWATGLWALGLYVAIQQLEGNIVTPIVQRRVAEVPAAVTLFAVMVGGVLFGPLGVILATPMAVLSLVLVKTVYLNEGLSPSAPPL
jgi:predicted PurR-regulated permease PerM